MATQDEFLGTDIRLINGDIQFDFNQDFKFVTGKANLSQALKNRLNTGAGELTYYDNYGSRLATLIGSPNNILIKNKGKGYIFESVARDARIKKITNTDITFASDSMRVEVSAVAITDNVESNLVFNIE